MELLFDVVLDTLKDTAILLPFLWVTYLLLEVLEQKAQDASVNIVRRAGNAGPAVGALLGVVPQCGFSAAACTLWAGRVISLGTLVAVLLSTGDELLPVFIAQGAPMPTLLAVIGTKLAIGLVVGFAIDFVMRLALHRGDEGLHIQEMCEREGCGCDGDEEGTWPAILKAATVHTLQVGLFILVLTFAIDMAIALLGADVFGAFMARSPVASILASAAVGLIPNCAASVVVAELFLAGTLSSPALLAGSLSATGVAYLVLFRTNASARQNVGVVALVYGVSVLFGLIMLATGLSF